MALPCKPKGEKPSYTSHCWNEFLKQESIVQSKVAILIVIAPVQFNDLIFIIFKARCLNQQHQKQQEQGFP